MRGKNQTLDNYYIYERGKKQTLDYYIYER